MIDTNEKREPEYIKITQRGLDILTYPDLMNDDASLKRFFTIRVWIRKLFKCKPTNSEFLDKEHQHKE